MPYLGDAPSNPVPITLVVNAAVVEATGPIEHDRHVCWFSLPAQAAGSNLLLTPQTEPNFNLVVLWDGGSTAYYLNDSPYQTKRAALKLPLPTMTPVLIGLFPRQSANFLLSANAPAGRLSFTGEASGLPGLTVAGWESLFAGDDLTKRLPTQSGISIVVDTAPQPPGTAANPMAIDFTTSATPVEVDLSSYFWQSFHADVTVPPGYGIEVTHLTNYTYTPPEVDSDEPLSLVYYLPERGPLPAATLFVVPPGAPARIKVSPGSRAFPDFGLAFRRIAISDVAGTPTDVDGTSAEPCNALLFRTQDAIRAVQAPSGSFSIPNVPQGDYILAVFSRADGRDIRATNILIPQGERVAGGGYTF